MPAGFAQSRAHRFNRPQPHDFRRHAGSGIAANRSQRRQAQLGGFFGRHQQQCRCAIVNAGSIAGSNRAVGFESGAQLGQGFGARIGFDVFILRDAQRLALALWHAHGRDFCVKPPLGARGGGFLLRSKRQCVLRFAADAELFHNVFGSDAHVVMMISIGEAI